MDKKEEALRIVEEGLKELESQKRKYYCCRTKIIKSFKPIRRKKYYYIWAEIELGNEIYIQPLQEFVNKMMEDQDAKKDISIYKDKEYQPILEKIKEVDIDLKFICTNNFLRLKT